MANKYANKTNKELLSLLTAKVKGLSKKKGFRLMAHILLKSIVPVPYNIADLIMTNREDLITSEKLNFDKNTDEDQENWIYVSDPKTLQECKKRLNEIENIITYEDTSDPAVEEKLERERYEICMYILDCTYKGKIRQFASANYKTRRRVCANLEYCRYDMMHADRELCLEIYSRIRTDDSGVYALERAEKGDNDEL